jgi:hypothetical protein
VAEQAKVLSENELERLVLAAASDVRDFAQHHHAARVLRELLSKEGKGG